MPQNDGINLFYAFSIAPVGEVYILIEFIVTKDRLRGFKVIAN